MEKELRPLPTVWVDPEQMESVVTNLLVNAREAMEGGGVLRVETDSVAEMARLTVRDEGSGMTPEFVAQSLFSSLSLHQKERTGGRNVSVQNDCGGSSRDDPGGKRPRSEAQLSRPAASEGLLKMKPKLLIVDDDEEIRTQMKWALAENFEIFIAGDREKALEVFRTTAPMVVLLDLGLPPRPNTPEEGFEVLTDVLALDPASRSSLSPARMKRKMRCGPSVPALMISSANRSRSTN